MTVVHREKRRKQHALMKLSTIVRVVSKENHILLLHSFLNLNQVTVRISFTWWSQNFHQSHVFTWKELFYFLPVIFVFLPSLWRALTFLSFFRKSCWPITMTQVIAKKCAVQICKVITVHPVGGMNVWTKRQGNPSESCPRTFQIKISWIHLLGAVTVCAVGCFSLNSVKNWATDGTRDIGGAVVPNHKAPSDYFF